MAPNNQKVVKPKRDRTNENFAKRIETLISKCDELREYQTDVFYSHAARENPTLTTHVAGAGFQQKKTW
jgi:hypothetical protein